MNKNAQKLAKDRWKKLTPEQRSEVNRKSVEAMHKAVRIKNSMRLKVIPS